MRLSEVIFDPDLEHGPTCGGDLKIKAAIPETPVIERILTDLGLQARAPPRTPARGLYSASAEHGRAGFYVGISSVTQHLAKKIVILIYASFSSNWSFGAK